MHNPDSIEWTEYPDLAGRIRCAIDMLQHGMHMWKSSLQGSDKSQFAAFLSDCAQQGNSYRQAYARWQSGDWSEARAMTALQLQRLLDYKDIP